MASPNRPAAGAPPRERLLIAAEQQFRRYGYRRTTIDDVAASAGTGKGSVYLHFTSKQDVYLAVVESSVERFLDRATTALLSDVSVPVRLRRLVEVTADHYGRDELLRSSLFGLPDLVDGPVAQRAADLQRGRIVALLADTLQAGAEEGTIRADLDPSTAAVVLFEVGWAIVRSTLDGSSELALSESLDILNDIVGRGIRVLRDRG